jgi:chromosome segregation ATPase
MADGSDNSLAGRSLEAAVDHLEDSRAVDRDRARAVLGPVSEDGTVRRAALREQLGHVAKVVATPESRIEFAAMALSETRELAEPVADLAVVQSRIEGYEARLASLESGVEDLQSTLQNLVDRADTADIYEVARDLHDLTSDANDVQRRADDLSSDLETFQSWLTEDDTRRTAFEEDLDLVESELAAVANTVESLETETVDRGRRWLDATLRSRLLELLRADLRAEWETLRSWADREAGDPAAWDEFEPRIGALADRHDALATDLEAGADPSWPERYAERLEGFSAAVEPADPPIDWAAVQSAFETHRPAIEPEVTD